MKCSCYWCLVHLRGFQCKNSASGKSLQRASAGTSTVHFTHFNSSWPPRTFARLQARIGRVDGDKMLFWTLQSRYVKASLTCRASTAQAKICGITQISVWWQIVQSRRKPKLHGWLATNHCSPLRPRYRWNLAQYAEYLTDARSPKAFCWLNSWWGLLKD